MKLKHIFIFIVFIILGSVIFYFGWIQNKLPENTYGIAFTKSKGYLNKVYEPGKFSWDYRKLIPNNFKLLKFNLSTIQLNVNIQEELPSGKTYSDFMPNSPDFSYKLNYYLTYSIKPEKLPELVSKLNLTPEQMPMRYETISGELKSAILLYYHDKNRLSGSIIIPENINNETADEIGKILKRQFPDLNIYDFVPYEVSLPDLQLYSKARELYFEALDSESKIIAESRSKIAEQEIVDAANFETLKKYGELLTEYPSLIDFFSVIEVNCDSIIPKVEIDLPAEQNQEKD